MKHNHRTGDVKRQCRSGRWFGAKDLVKEEARNTRRAQDRANVEAIRKGADPDEIIWATKNIHSSNWWNWD
jgi:hypothetical protein